MNASKSSTRKTTDSCVIVFELHLGSFAHSAVPIPVTMKPGCSFAHRYITRQQVMGCYTGQYCCSLSDIYGWISLCLSSLPPLLMALMIVLLSNSSAWFVPITSFEQRKETRAFLLLFRSLPVRQVPVSLPCAKRYLLSPLTVFKLTSNWHSSHRAVSCWLVSSFGLAAE